MDTASLIFHIFIVGSACVVSQFPIPNVPTPSCLTCQYLSSPSACQHSRPCHPGETCFLGEVSEDNGTFYIQYCYPDPGCRYMKNLVEQGQSDLRGYHFNWISCCNTDNCNNSTHTTT